MSDPQGRYTIIWGKLGADSVTLANCYGPNTDKPTFFTTLWGKILNIGSTHITWGGDFNVALDPRQDRSNTATHHYTHAREALAGIIEEGGLTDSWRHTHPQIREGTHYTTYAATWARLDYCLLSRGLVMALCNTTHLARTYSDHCPVQITIKSPGYDRPRSCWRLQPTALLDPFFHRELGEEIQDFFVRNKGSVDQVEMIWEAFKATIRGFYMYKSYGVLRDLQRSLGMLERDLKGLEDRMSTGETGQVQTDYHEKLSAYEEDADREIKFRGRYWVARRYGEGERPGRALAEITRQSRFSSHILDIQGPGEVLYRDTQDILGTFTAHYRALYTTQRKGTLRFDDFLDGVKLQKLDDPQCEFLSAPFEIDEIREAIMQMQSSKALGLDGIPI